MRFRKIVDYSQSNQHNHVQVCNDTNARFQPFSISAYPLSLICNLAVNISEENESKDNVPYKPLQKQKKANDQGKYLADERQMRSLVQPVTIKHLAQMSKLHVRQPAIWAFAPKPSEHTSQLNPGVGVLKSFKPCPPLQFSFHSLLSKRCWKRTQDWHCGPAVRVRYVKCLSSARTTH